MCGKPNTGAGRLTFKNVAQPETYRLTFPNSYPVEMGSFSLGLMAYLNVKFTGVPLLIISTELMLSAEAGKEL